MTHKLEVDGDFVKFLFLEQELGSAFYKKILNAFLWTDMKATYFHSLESLMVFVKKDCIRDEMDDPFQEAILWVDP